MKIFDTFTKIWKLISKNRLIVSTIQEKKTRIFTYLRFLQSKIPGISPLGINFDKKKKLEFYDFITSLGNGTLEKHKETINKLESTAEDLDSLRNVRISNLRFPDREITELFDKLGTVLII